MSLPTKLPITPFLASVSPTSTVHAFQLARADFFLIVLIFENIPCWLACRQASREFFKNQNNQKSSALASLNPCTVEVAETNARKEGIGSFVGSDMCCLLFLFMNQSLQHTPCMRVLNPIVSTFHHCSKAKKL